MPNYKLLDEKNQEVKQHDLQDKAPWCKTGATFEEVFVEKYGQQFGLIINPQKEDNIYAPDLLNTTNNSLGDLKTQNTPFFQASQRYDLDPQFAVTFNVKDYKRYLANYPTIEIYFWVKWIVTGFEKNDDKIQVQPMEGIWKIEFDNLIELCKTSPIHTYGQRIYDNKGNAKDSYVLDLRNERFKTLLRPLQFD